ncbi:germin-like protein 9-3 [Cryptomeria japonica]|uniref:germin-like protein 9-3 n=1 Tax=Cryptomeria japonica TaxID=3369 RepID=UPI0027DAA03C|nr:germin-like protein 9-3 [Cryptomeria japonica]
MEFNGACLMEILVAFSSVGVIYASDPDILTDFLVSTGSKSDEGSGRRVSDAKRVGRVNGDATIPVVDNTGKLFTQTLISGDLFVFPKGLLHYQLNTDVAFEALAISAFGSANAGTMSVPSTLFTIGIPEDVLAKSFKTNTQTIKLLKGGLKST